LLDQEESPVQIRLLLFALLAPAALPAGAAGCPSLLDHQYKTLQGPPVNLCEFADRPILVVNTASKCGFTPQFEKLESMYRKYKDKGLLVVGFPSNDFRQELASNKEIGEFCLLTYNVEFPMVEKSSVTGATADPLFKQLHDATGEQPKWNFHKYLIAPGGKQVYSFGTRIEPDGPEIMSKLTPLLR
jgi:glutathione peroxidase